MSYFGPTGKRSDLGAGLTLGFRNESAQNSNMTSTSKIAPSVCARSEAVFGQTQQIPMKRQEKAAGAGSARRGLPPARVSMVGSSIRRPMGVYGRTDR